MQFDQLHNKLFALAKKGTQDEHFVDGKASRIRSGKKNPSGKLNAKKESEHFTNKVYPTSRRAIKNLKNIQFTLFD